MSAVEVITVDSRGPIDRAEADTAEDALVAARVLLAEAYDAHRVQGYAETLSVRFIVAGRVTQTATYASLGGLRV